jgi:chorismate-pyruvate lyase
VTSRARRLAERRRPRHSRGPLEDSGATDGFPGLGRVEQLVLRGDGLTTTSLSILTGEDINVRVEGHWNVTVSSPTADRLPGGTMHFDGDGADVDGYIYSAVTYLDADVDDDLLVRDVLLVGAGGTVHGSAEVVAMRYALPKPVTQALASTDQPIGRLLRDNNVPVTRELRRWGLIAAGAQATRLGAGLTASSRVPGRTYVMRLSATGKPLAALTERFAPHVFQHA